VAGKREEVTENFWRSSEREFAPIKMSRRTSAATADFILAAFGIGLRSGNNHQSCGHKFVDDADECSGNRKFAERHHESSF
jgi:hypothetical protein